MKKIILIIIAILFFIFLGIVIYYNFFKAEITFKEDLEVKVNEEVYIKHFIKNAKNMEVLNKKEKIDTSKVGKIKVKIKTKTKLGKENYSLEIYVIDDEAPQIEAKKEITITSGDKLDLLKDVKVTDNSNEKITAKIEGTYDTNKAGTYNLKYVALDSSGNKAESDLKIIVKEKIIVKSQNNTQTKKTTNKSYIKINRKQNVVMIYSGDNKLIKIFVCSTGSATPIGTFYTTDKYVWRPLFGNVYGQYATRITGSILFHSVPYFKQSKDTLEYEEYNKLGTAASMGCIRLTVEDAKWIYDNMPKGTKVIIYDSDSLDGITKPYAKKIDVNSPNRGWDPTDPDPNNPWKG